jgi:hypothetical protein
VHKSFNLAAQFLGFYSKNKRYGLQGKKGLECERPPQSCPLSPGIPRGGDESRGQAGSRRSGRLSGRTKRYFRDTETGETQARDVVEQETLGWAPPSRARRVSLARPPARLLWGLQGNGDVPDPEPNGQAAWSPGRTMMPARPSHHGRPGLKLWLTQSQLPFSCPGNGYNS